MGWRFETKVWLHKEGRGFGWEPVYGGNSMIKAILAAHKAKKTSKGAVKVEWR